MRKNQIIRWGICFLYLLVMMYAVICSLQRRALGSFLPIWLDAEPSIHIKFSLTQFVEGVTVFWKAKLLRILFYAFCAFCIRRIAHYLSIKKMSLLIPIFIFFTAAYEGVNFLFNAADRTIDLFYLPLNLIGILLGVGLAIAFGKLFSLFISKMTNLCRRMNLS